jgi:site-specific DNA-methyltransferase (adenine-specific)
MAWASGNDWELRRGRWQDVLADVGECDALISDPPYSARTHSGHDSAERNDVSESEERDLHFNAWTVDDVHEFVEAWEPRVRGWIVAMTDHVLFPAYESALTARGRYVFAPVIYLAPGSRVRLQGDGPASWATHIVVARRRTKEAASWGALPGGYTLPNKHNARSANTTKKGEAIVGGKPLWIMQRLVRHYSRRGDMICDPCAGAATTLLAATIEGRRAIGAEVNDERYELAARRLGKPCQPALAF